MEANAIKLSLKDHTLSIINTYNTLTTGDRSEYEKLTQR